MYETACCKISLQFVHQDVYIHKKLIVFCQLFFHVIIAAENNVHIVLFVSTVCDMLSIVTRLSLFWIQIQTV